jgi:hypothetical protein
MSNDDFVYQRPHPSSDPSFKLVKTFAFESKDELDAFLDSECDDRLPSPLPGVYNLPKARFVLDKHCVKFAVDGNTVRLYDYVTMADESPYQ